MGSDLPAWAVRSAQEDVGLCIVCYLNFFGVKIDFFACSQRNGSQVDCIGNALRTGKATGSLLFFKHGIHPNVGFSIYGS